MYSLYYCSVFGAFVEGGSFDFGGRMPDYNQTFTVYEDEAETKVKDTVKFIVIQDPAQTTGAGSNTNGDTTIMRMFTGLLITITVFFMLF